MALNPAPLLNLFEKSLTILHKPEPTDSIYQCPRSALHLLPTCPSALIRLAYFKIHSFPFSEVPICWRRLYTDASIGEAARFVKEALAKDGFGGESEGVEGNVCKGDWVGEVVRLLDMAIIMTGAPERREMITELFSALEIYLEEENEGEDERPRKRRRIGEDEAFLTGDDLKVPRISWPIHKHSGMSMGGFEKHLPSAQPIVIQNALTHWPAFHERPWKSPAYLLNRTLGGRRLVPVELGRSYTDEGWGQKITTFKEFLDRYMLQKSASKVVGDAGEDKSGTGYLAQHDLFAQIPSLRNDISTPDFCYTEPPPPAPGTPLAQKKVRPEQLCEPLLNAWFGPAGTVSPLHTDPYHNILCQVVGRKYVRLYSPFETPKLYTKGTEVGGVDMSNTSEVDVEGDEGDRDRKFPLFKEVRYVETVLEEGECIYVPVGWWHYIRSLSVSVSVSFWWN